MSSHTGRTFSDTQQAVNSDVYNSRPEPIHGRGVPLTDEEAMLRSGDVSVRIQERLRVTVTPQMHEAIRAHHVAEAEVERIKNLIGDLERSLVDATDALSKANGITRETGAKLAATAKAEKM